MTNHTFRVPSLAGVLANKDEYLTRLAARDEDGLLSDLDAHIEVYNAIARASNDEVEEAFELYDLIPHLDSLYRTQLVRGVTMETRSIRSKLLIRGWKRYNTERVLNGLEPVSAQGRDAHCSVLKAGDKVVTFQPRDLNRTAPYAFTGVGVVQAVLDSDTFVVSNSNGATTDTFDGADIMHTTERGQLSAKGIMHEVHLSLMHEVRSNLTRGRYPRVSGTECESAEDTQITVRTTNRAGEESTFRVSVTEVA